MIEFLLAGAIVLGVAFFAPKAHSQTGVRPDSSAFTGTVCTTVRTATVCTVLAQPVGSECTCINASHHKEKGNVSH